jgi:hypothetical protein
MDIATLGVIDLLPLIGRLGDTPICRAELQLSIVVGAKQRLRAPCGIAIPVPPLGTNDSVSRADDVMSRHI